MWVGGLGGGVAGGGGREGSVGGVGREGSEGGAFLLLWYARTHGGKGLGRLFRHIEYPFLPWTVSHPRDWEYREELRQPIHNIGALAEVVTDRPPRHLR